jgi:hydrogenase maturation factor
MNIGKLTNEQLQQSVLSILRPMRGEVVLRAGIGEDCAALDFGSRLCVVSTDPVTAAQKDLGRLAVHVSCNDAASSGAEPIAMLLTLMAPPKTNIGDIEFIMRQALETAQQMNVEIIGGHTEITDAVTRPILSGTVLAACPREDLVRTSGGKPGDALVMTKTAGLEGTYIIATDFADKALPILGKKDHAACLALESQISVVPEGLLAAKLGAHAMHDVTEGGILGAVHELVTASGTGVLVTEEEIAVLPQTKKLCAALRIDALRLISSGCMLIACPDGEAMKQALTGAGIHACVIGSLCEREEGLFIQCRDGQMRPLGEPRADELFKLSRQP